MITNEDQALQRRLCAIALAATTAGEFTRDALLTTPNAWFTDLGARTVHQCILAQSQPTPLTVAKAIQESGLITGPGLGPLLADLIAPDDGRTTRGQVRMMIDMIRAAYIRHRLECMAGTVSAATSRGVTPEDGMAMIEAEIADIRATSQAGAATFGTIKNAVAKLNAEIDAIQTQLANGEATSVISTGIENLDRQLFAGGFTPGQMVFVGARPGQGKSSFLVSCAVNMARARRRVGIITLEMRDTEIAGIMVQHCGNVSLKPLYSRPGNAEEMMGFVTGASEVAEFSIWMDSSTSMNIEQVCSRVTHMVNSLGCEIVFVDYAQRIKRRPNVNTVDELTLISERLTDLAKQLNVPLVGLVQLNRDVEGIPSLEHFKGTGQFEQDAHVAILLHRPEANKLDGEFVTPGHEPMNLVLAKQRRGGTGIIAATFHRELQRIQ